MTTDLHNKLQLEPIDEYAHSLGDYLGCNEGEMLKELKQREQATINATLEYVRELVEKNIAIHKQLESEVVAHIVDRGTFNKPENPHTFVVEQLELVLQNLTPLTDNNSEV